MYTKHVTDMLLDKPSYELSSKQKKNEIKKKKTGKRCWDRNKICKWKET